MANIADCMVCIAKEDLAMLDGGIRKAKKGEKTRQEYKITYRDKGGNKHEVIDKWANDEMSHEFILDGKTVSREELEDKGFTVGGEWEVLVDQVVSGDWLIDWKKLKGYSYQFETWVEEYDSFISIEFGGRWDFPADMEKFLNESGVRWQGAVFDDSMDFRESNLGNSFMGIIIVKDESDEDEGWQWHRFEIVEGLEACYNENKKKKSELLKRIKRAIKNVPADNEWAKETIELLKETQDFMEGGLS